ncbi:MAG: hypothetical protein AAGC55_32415, partial [Myxococcota bacterium]
MKARLGLKKGGGQAAGPGVPRPPTSGGLVPPPGVQQATPAVPPPPGAKPPAPHIPDASDDPFAAMNAMAAVGAQQHAAKGPEIVVVNDGGPVESVETKSRLLDIGKYVIMILAPLIVGIAVGQISSGANLVNETIEDAAVLAADVKDLRKVIAEKVQTPLLNAKSRGPGGQSFIPNDKELTDSLTGEELLPEIDQTLVFNSRMYYLAPDLVEKTLEFYSGVAQLKEMVTEHVKSARNDANAMQLGKKNREEAKPDKDVNAYIASSPYGYGVVIVVPDEKKKQTDFGARVVELGPPVCADARGRGQLLTEGGQCQGGPPLGFGYREASVDGSNWRQGKPGAPQGEAVGANVLIPILPSGIFEELVKGGNAS